MSYLLKSWRICYQPIISSSSPELIRRTITMKLFLVLCHLALSFGFGFRPPRKIGIIPNWLSKPMNQLVQVRFDKTLPRRLLLTSEQPKNRHRHRHRPIGVRQSSADDIISRIDVLTKAVKEAIKSKPFLRVYT